MVRKDLPYLVLSLAVHAGLLALLLAWRLPSLPEPQPRRVLLEFRRAGPGPSPPRLEPAGGLPVPARRVVPGLRVPEGERLALPSAWSAPAGRPVRRAAAAETPRRLPGAAVRVSGATGAAALPAPAQILRALVAEEPPAPTAGAAEAGSGAEGGAAGGSRASGDAAAPPAGYMQTTALEWEEGERSLLLRPRLGFPELLLEKGLDAEVEAAFVVAPSGQVTWVQIIRSSGFSSVDREVEQALRGALFAESSEQGSGRIQFRFRLERKE